MSIVCNDRLLLFDAGSFSIDKGSEVVSGFWRSYVILRRGFSLVWHSTILPFIRKWVLLTLVFNVFGSLLTLETVISQKQNANLLARFSYLRGFLVDI